MAASLGDRIRTSFEQRLSQVIKARDNNGNVESGKLMASSDIQVPLGSAQGQSTKVNTKSGELSTRNTVSAASGSDIQRGKDYNATEEVDFPPLPTRSQTPPEKRKGVALEHSYASTSKKEEHRQEPRPNAWITRPRLVQNRFRKVDNPYLTPGSMPTRDELEKWLEWSILQDLKVNLTQLRVLGRQIYLMVVANTEERDRLLQASPLDFDGCPVNLAPWTPDYNPKNSRVKRVATWVELPSIDPLFEPLSDKMLAMIGQPTYRTMTRGQNRYPNVRGCVMVEEGKEKHLKLAFQCPWEGVIVQNVKYQEVSNMCFNCKRAGHMAKDCPFPSNNGNGFRQAQKDQNLPGLRGGMNRGGPGRVFSRGLGGSQQIEEDSDDEFLEVKHSKSARGKKEASPIQSEENKKTLPENIEDFGDAGGQGIDQQGVEVTKEEAREASVDDSQKHHDTTQLLEEVGIQMDMAAVLPTFNWADLGEAEMPDAGTRGIKGRSSEVDPNHTPDRGNTSKRRPGKQGNYQRVDTFQELGVKIQGDTRDLTQRTTRQETKDLVERGDPPDLLPNNSRRSLFLSTGDHGAEEDTGDKPEKSAMETKGINYPDEQTGVITSPVHRTRRTSRRTTNHQDRMTVNQLRVASWNVRGLVSNYRTDIVKRWVRRNQKGLHVLALQEVIAQGDVLKKTLKAIIPGGKTIVDYKRNGKSDTVLVLRRSLTVSAEGVSGLGFGAWAVIETCRGEVGILAVHAPGKRRKRARMWQWVKNIIAKGQWLVIGDFNMVESTKDSIGPSVVLRGRELRSWNLCSNQGDLIDSWLTALESKGPWFTRQALHGNRLDQSRLDRIYISNRGEWVDIIPEMVHQGTCSLSDHIPVGATLILEKQNRIRENRRETSYFKMRPGLMMRSGVLQAAEEEWRNHPGRARDERKRWALALGRIRKLLMVERDRQDVETEEVEVLQNMLHKIRTDLQRQDTSRKRVEFEETMKKLRLREKLDAQIARVRCRVKWLQEGDTPSKFFFALLKAKRAQENITVLRTEDGGLITEEEEILEMVQDNYSRLYNYEQEESSVRGKSEEALSLIDGRLTEEQNEILRQYRTKR
ncbi:hypothetical protein R1sor_000918 [Riccia sorocarpa]|uniref:CCHC-type domain-containing protein n=1 Tax=Riccia sorocarpa TaxID=122646 RepID=A0ABD3GW71_9MARC